ncbi:hypothetical protein [Rhizobium sp. CNPSo 3490]|uniref:hypothetical protein n=1 Tax=Rhizobium sp. CNPSo 3490 TaxID=3021407 RepID=UPI00254BEC86|nr:hypothetical protein [Rhizobium sp. CNPSo 3490]MDK4736477.1 hypothetical protein [Rhizobium sp. CNPSo 3490]
MTYGDVKDCNFYNCGGPTPIDDNRQPDLTPLIAASRTVASLLKVGDIVVLESTVFPGATEEDMWADSFRNLGAPAGRGLQPRLFAGAHQSR